MCSLQSCNDSSSCILGGSEVPVCRQAEYFRNDKAASCVCHYRESRHWLRPESARSVSAPGSTGSAREVPMDRNRDLDPVETREWLDSLESVLEVDGPERAHFLLEQVIDSARHKGAPVPYSATTPYVNTILVERQTPHPGDRVIEHRIRSAVRWNALAIVL